jgi:hypothetical protein
MLAIAFSASSFVAEAFGKDRSKICICTLYGCGCITIGKDKK